MDKFKTLYETTKLQYDKAAYKTCLEVLISRIADTDATKNSKVKVKLKEDRTGKFIIKGGKQPRDLWYNFANNLLEELQTAFNLNVAFKSVSTKKVILTAKGI
jgi:hypothetical protein